MVLVVGMRYGGSSITNGVSSPFTRNLLNNLAISTARRIPIVYMDKRIKLPLFGKNAPISTKYIGRRALHDISGLTRIVMRRHLRSSIIREAIMAGTLHPKPMISGMNDFPCKPIRCMILSMMKAARAM